MMTKISVVVPIYNVEPYLSECLESIINQTLKEIEIILVDDGSKDLSGKICDEYRQKDPRIQVIHQINSGVSIARNVGFQRAKGEYIIFLDSDDVFNLTLLEKLYQNAIETDADIVICRENSFTGNEQPKKIEPNPFFLPVMNKFRPEDFKKYLFNFCTLWPWDKLYKRAFLNKCKILYPPDRRIMGVEDMVFVGETLACATQISIIPDYLINHRYHKTSLEATRSQDAGFLALCELKKRLETRKLYGYYQQSFINFAIQYLNWHYSTRKEDKQEVYQKMKEWFKYLGIFQFDMDYFYDPALFKYCYEYILEKPYSAISPSQKWQQRIKYLKYRLLSKITFGKKRIHYQQKKKQIKYYLKNS